MNIPNNLFDLSDEQISTSKMMYNGKIIKCLVAPYHSYRQLEQVLPYTKSTYLFPEREMSYLQTRLLISMVSNSTITDEILIITSSIPIIGDIVSGLVRVLDQRGDIQESDVKTFAANQHDIRLGLLENTDYEISDGERSSSTRKIQDVIDKINSGKMTEDEVNEATLVIDSIGEVIIRSKLQEMLREVAPNKTSFYLTTLKTGKITVEMGEEIFNYIKNLGSGSERNQLIDGLKNVDIV
jgi:hypothetical protein